MIATGSSPTSWHTPGRTEGRRKPLTRNYFLTTRQERRSGKRTLTEVSQMSVLWGDDPRTDGAEWGQARLLSLLALFVLLACLLARGHRTPDKTPNKTPNKVSQMRVR